jgi:hypothetical protein
VVLCGSALAAEKMVEVELRMEGDEVVIDARCYVEAALAEVWDVITDYDHAARFISSLDESAIVTRGDNTMVISQKGTLGLGPFSVTIESVNALRLVPMQLIEAHLISGTMKSYDATARLIPDPPGVWVTYHARSVPGMWIPPVIGPLLLRHEARQRFDQLLDEVLRRKAQR